MRPYSDDTTTVRVNIRSGMSIEAIADLLHQKKLIRDPLVFTIWSRLTGSDVKAGQHQIAPSFSVIKIANELRTTVNSEMVVTIPSGKTLKSLTEVFKDYGYSDEEIVAAYNKTYDSPILADKPASASLEGYIFPDTYNVFTSDDLSVLIQKAIDNMHAKVMVSGLWTSSATNGWSFYETLTLSSIVEKEASDPAQKKQIAGVFFNRLNIGMKLQACPTFQYAYKNGLCNVNGPSCDSAYNTYQNPGLPPGPIANVEITSIEAVINPTATHYYYFLAGDDGVIRYAVDSDQHQANIWNYCRENCF